MILVGQNGDGFDIRSGSESRQFGFHGIHQQAAAGEGRKQPRHEYFLGAYFGTTKGHMRWEKL